jgi:hypothetical protein
MHKNINKSEVVSCSERGSKHVSDEPGNCDQHRARRPRETYSESVGTSFTAEHEGVPGSETHKTLFPGSCRIRKAQDLRCVVEEAINTARTDILCTPLQKARALGYLVGIGIRVVESANLEQRIEALEQVLAERPTPAIAGTGGRT